MRSNLPLMKYLFKKTGLKKGWLLDRLEWSQGYIEYAANQRGFRTDEAAQIEDLLHSLGYQINAFKFTADIKSDIQKLSDEYGIKKVYWADALGIDQATFKNILSRQSGLTEDELSILQSAKDSIVLELKNFTLKKAKIKAA